MIYSLTGLLTYLGSNFFVVNCGGVGYKCKSDGQTIQNLEKSLSKEIKVFTVLNIRENSWDLFGFSDSYYADCFKLLTSVSGVGPKVALSILSEISPSEILSFISSDAHSNFVRISGVGDKMARRIVLELKEKIKKIPINIQTTDNNKLNAARALEVLGYSLKEISPILETLDCSQPTTFLIEQALKMIGK